MSETPHGRTNVIDQSSSQQYLDQILLHGLIAGRIGRKEGIQACYFSAALPQESNAVLDQKSWQPRSRVPSTTRGMSTRFMNMFWSKHKTWVKHSTTYSIMLVHFGDIPTECIARVVGHEQTILHEGPSDVAPHAPAIQADVRASGGRLLDPDQHQKRFHLIRTCVNSMQQAPHREEFQEELLQ